MDTRAKGPLPRKVKKTWILPTARAERLDPDAPLPRPPASPAEPWIPSMEIPREFPAYREN